MWRVGTAADRAAVDMHDGFFSSDNVEAGMAKPHPPVPESVNGKEYWRNSTEV